jgi:hypothetical protein
MHPLSENCVSLPQETVKRIESMSKKESSKPVAGSLEARHHRCMNSQVSGRHDTCQVCFSWKLD